MSAFPYTLKKILELNPITYKISNDSRKFIGFNPIELKEKIPELVIEPNNPDDHYVIRMDPGFQSLIVKGNQIINPEIRDNLHRIQNMSDHLIELELIMRDIELWTCYIEGDNLPFFVEIISQDVNGYLDNLIQAVDAGFPIIGDAFPLWLNLSNIIMPEKYWQCTGVSVNPIFITEMAASDTFQDFLGEGETFSDLQDEMADLNFSELLGWITENLTGINVADKYNNFIDNVNTLDPLNIFTERTLPSPNERFVQLLDHFVLELFFIVIIIQLELEGDVSTLLNSISIPLTLLIGSSPATDVINNVIAFIDVIDEFGFCINFTPFEIF